MDQGSTQLVLSRMKKIRDNIIIVFALVLVLAAAAHGSDTNVKAAGSDKGLVFTTPQNEGIFTAYMAAVFEALAHRMDIPCTLAQLPKKRCLTDADKGLYDGVAARVTGLDAMGYRNLIRINVSHYTVQHIVFARPAGIIVGLQNMADLMKAATRSHFLIGYLRGSKKAELLLADLPADNKIALDLPQQAFRMLGGGRIIAYLAGPGITSRAVLKNLKASAPKDEGLQAVQEIFIASESQLFPYLHVKHERLIPGFEAALRSMKADGSLEKLYRAVQ